MSSNLFEKSSLASKTHRKGKQKQVTDNILPNQIDNSSDISEILHGRLSSSSMKGTTRYTIASKGSPRVEIQASEESDGRPIQRPPPAAIMHDARSHVATMDLVSHAGQSAKINLPQIGDDPTSRLEGLKLYKGWSERIREESQQHSQGAQCVVPHTAQVVESTAPQFKAETISKLSTSATHPAYHTGLPIRRRSDSVDTCLDAAPTPSSSPAVVPVANATPRATLNPLSNSSLVYSTSLPGLSLPETVVPERASKPQRKRSVVINAIPTSELLQRSSSRSSSHSKSLSALKNHARDHKYPPVSFPKTFNEHEPQSRVDSANMPLPTPRRSTPSISPLTKPKEDVSINSQSQPPATPHDERGRPTFYSTIHYYSECPHASPPATRPLDPDFQPRRDLDFHPTNRAITRSIIPGSCFNCDTMHRRAQENVVLDDFTIAIARFRDKLVLRLDQLDQLEQLDEASSDTEFEAYSEDVDRLRASCTFPEDAHDLRHQLSSMSLPPLHDQPDAVAERRHLTVEERSFQAQLVKEIRQTEAAIDRMRTEQEAKVKAVWAGYTRRWGPATLGVQRGNWTTKLEKYETKDDHDAMLEHTRRSIDQRLAMPDEIEQLDLEEGKPIVQVVGNDEDQEDDGVSTRSTSRQRTIGNRTLRRPQKGLSRGPNQRMCSPSIRDNPAALNPGEGKMQISWHR